MTDDPFGAIEALLVEAEAAHGIYEATELGGVYDQAWPAWYAAYVVDHGLGDLVDRPIDTGELAGFLRDTFADFGREAPPVAWSAYVAGRIAAAR